MHFHTAIRFWFGACVLVKLACDIMDEYYMQWTNKFFRWECQGLHVCRHKSIDPIRKFENTANIRESSWMIRSVHHKGYLGHVICNRKNSDTHLNSTGEGRYGV